MTIEEKAKRYDEAVEKARQIHDADRVSGIELTTCEEIFPELAESEDEKIRKALISRYQDDGCLCTNEYRIDYKDIRAWLEKQGKPTEINPSEFDSQLNRLLKQFESLSKDDIASSLSFYLNVVQNDGTYKEEKQSEPSWSEEDESHIRYLIECLENCKKGVSLTMTTSTSQEYINWLKSLRPQKQWRPSGFHLECISDAIAMYKERGINSIGLKDILEELKKLKG